MYKTAAGKYVVLLAGATCFGVPQPDSGSWSGNFPVGPATQRWGGTGIFAYVADKPLGPYTLHGNINNAAGGLHNSSGEHGRWQTTVLAGLRCHTTALCWQGARSAWVTRARQANASCRCSSTRSCATVSVATAGLG